MHSIEKQIKLRISVLTTWPHKPSYSAWSSSSSTSSEADVSFKNFFWFKAVLARTDSSSIAVLHDFKGCSMQENKQTWSIRISGIFPDTLSTPLVIIVPFSQRSSSKRHAQAQCMSDRASRGFRMLVAAFQRNANEFSILNGDGPETIIRRLT